MNYTLVPDVVLYHANCQDGFAAAWAAYQRWGMAPQYIPASYDKPVDLEVIKGRDVLIVDFSFKKDTLILIGNHANSVVILDHHVSAMKELEDFIDITQYDGDAMRALNHSRDAFGYAVAVLFDKERSGAGITWDELHTQPRPAIISYAEDRDLWRFNLNASKAISMWLFSYPYDFPRWDHLSQTLDGADFSVAVAEGRAILRRQAIDIEGIIQNARAVTLFGIPDVWMVNAPKCFSSDIAGELAERGPFAFSYSIDEFDMVHLSLRSRKNTGSDVSIIARELGGGGHKNAAGITMPLRQFLEEISQ